MSIHAHTVQRKMAEMDRMIKEINPLNDWINLYGYDNMDNEDKKYFAKMNGKIRKLNKKINRMSDDYYMI